MSSILVPPRVAAALAMQNLVAAILQHIAFEPDPAAGGAATKDREKWLTISELKDAFERLGVEGEPRNRVMAKLLREKIIQTNGTHVWIGKPQDLRACLAKRNGPSLVTA